MYFLVSVVVAVAVAELLSQPRFLLGILAATAVFSGLLVIDEMTASD